MNPEHALQAPRQDDSIAIKQRSALLVFVVTAVVLVSLALSQFFVDQRAERATAEGLERALASFAVARGINAVVSFVQSWQLSLQLGVGSSIAPGQWLDPLNQLIEEFSAIMLAASVAFGVQLFLLKMGAHWLVSALLGVIAVVWGVCTWRGMSARIWLTRALIGVCVVRFVMPLTIVGSDVAFRPFMQSEYAVSYVAAQAASKDSDVDAAAPSTVAEFSDPSFWEKVKNMGNIPERWDEIKRRFDALKVAKRYEALKAWAKDGTEHVIQLAVIFLMQTILVPLLIVWGMLRCARMLVEVSAPRSAA